MKSTSNRITLNLDGNAEVSLKAFIAPIEYTQRNYHVEWDALANFRVVEPEKQHPTSVFRAFLPPGSVSVGECWQIEEGILELLRQLHPNPRLDLHINNGDSYGLWACLRAYNDKVADVVFRIHAEFAIEGGRFTPSQFAGRLIIDRIKEEIVFFQMHVPKGTLNFDVYWNTMGSDIGYCPQVELCTGRLPHGVKFTASIRKEKAERALISCFYKFQRINWVSLAEALEMAPAQQKPVHAVSLDGPLFDESC
ncbi:hypothetical protein F4Z99_16910 [Candidatus Poribacteria bacterium]|nr:hypothetical protein [Candidatus Poribacteria bacterium]MYB01509.1 hypothetical protein [Candidatus Poribacteria bacterium]